MRVLIVEDSEQVRNVIKQLLDDQVDEFFECDDGADALGAYVKHRPDVILMDLKMREVDGFEATRSIKSECSEAHVVIVSQWDSPALRAAALKWGAEDYVNKQNLLPLRQILKSHVP